jgi:hypothetical protein
MMYSQATRTWVSGVGDDANPCSRTAPCKTFAGAISKTADGGEIDVLDPGGFGALTITKSITLDGGGGQVASILVAGTNGIVVAAPANANVIIRNLRFDGLLGGGNANAGLTGIKFISGHDLNVENCVIFGFNQNGVDVALSQNTQATAHIVNTVIKNIAGVGIHATNSQSPAVQVTVSGSTVVPLGSGAGNIGIEAAQHSKVDVSNTLVAHAGSDGMKADDAATNDANLFVINSQVDFNANGITAAAGGVVVAGGVEGGSTGVLFNNTSGGGANYFVYNGTNQNPGTTGTSGVVNGIPRIP